ncbi:hypothetical protein GGX14DRAFT_617357, partial [Mycena pura]
GSAGDTLGVAAPAWAKNAKKILEDVGDTEMGADWSSIVQLWWQLEKRAASDPDQTHATTGRPKCVGIWVKNARKGTPTIEGGSRGWNGIGGHGGGGLILTGDCGETSYCVWMGIGVTEMPGSKRFPQCYHLLEWWRAAMEGPSEAWERAIADLKWALECMVGPGIIEQGAPAPPTDGIPTSSALLPISVPPDTGPASPAPRAAVPAAPAPAVTRPTRASYAARTALKALSLADSSVPAGIRHRGPRPPPRPPPPADVAPAPDFAPTPAPAPPPPPRPPPGPRPRPRPRRARPRARGGCRAYANGGSREQWGRRVASGGGTGAGGADLGAIFFGHFLFTRVAREPVSIILK